MITKLKIQIDKSGLKQKWIAQRLNMDPSLMCKYVTGDRVMPDSDLSRIAEILNVKIEDIKE